MDSSFFAALSHRYPIVNVDVLWVCAGAQPHPGQAACWRALNTAGARTWRQRHRRTDALRQMCWKNCEEKIPLSPRGQPMVEFPRKNLQELSMSLYHVITFSLVSTRMASLTLSECTDLSNYCGLRKCKHPSNFLLFHFMHCCFLSKYGTLFH